MNKQIKNIYIIALTAALGFAPAAFAQETEAADSDSVQELKAELAGVKAELQAVRKDLQTIMRQLRTMNTKQTPKRQTRRPAMDLLGKPAPKHSFTTYKDEAKTLGGESEDVKVVMFYASWCGFCKRSLPNFEKLKNDYKDKNVEVMTISLDDRSGRRASTEEQIIQKYEKMGITVPMALDPTKKIGRDYKVQSFPTSFVLGKNGVIEAVHVGGPTDLRERIAKQVDQLLEGKSLVEKKSG